jgi:hypothetical protein
MAPMKKLKSVKLATTAETVRSLSSDSLRAIAGASNGLACTGSGRPSGLCTTQSQQ